MRYTVCWHTHGSARQSRTYKTLRGLSNRMTRIFASGEWVTYTVYHRRTP